MLTRAIRKQCHPSPFKHNADTSMVVNHPAFGPALPDAGWVPAPRYLLRRARIMSMVSDLRPGQALDVGCGPGALMAELAGRGFACTGLETSPAAHALAGLLHQTSGVDMVDAPGTDWSGRFDLLCAFEVLEHIEDDRAALESWLDWLAPGGTVLLSMPAHPEAWNSYDAYVGHYRRYTRADMIALADACGLEVEVLECYGYPLANIMEKVRVFAYARKARENADASMDTATGQSGVNRPIESKAWPLLAHGPGRWAMNAAIVAQRPFLGRDLGNGYLMRARRRPPDA